MKKWELVQLLSDMSVVIGQIKSEAETTPGVNRSGVTYVSIRLSSLNRLLTIYEEQWLPFLLTLLEDDEVVVRKGIDEIPLPTCTCPTECDCQNPDGEGVKGISNSCPIHNFNPMPDEECPVHGG